MKIKNFCCFKAQGKTMDGLTTYCKKIFSISASDGGLVSKIHQEQSTPNNKMKTHKAFSRPGNTVYDTVRMDTCHVHFSKPIKSATSRENPDVTHSPLFMILYLV